MRAVVLTSFTGIDGLELADVPDPVPAKGEQIVHVRAASSVRGTLGIRMALSRQSEVPRTSRRSKGGTSRVRPTTGSGFSGSSRNRG